MKELCVYDPQAEAKWERLYKRLPALWQQARADKQELGRIHPDTKAAYVGTIRGMRKQRKRKYRTVADVARRYINILKARAALRGVDFKAPEATDFEQLADLRAFYKAEMQRFGREQLKRRTIVTFSLPVLPRGEGEIFNGLDAIDYFCAPVFVPDVGGGMVFTLITQILGDEHRVAAISSRDNPSRVRQYLPELADKLCARIFAGEDAQGIDFYVHHPIGCGRNGAEQFWHYDVRQGLRGAFCMAGRQSMNVLPYGIAHKKFIGDVAEQDASVLVLDRYVVYRPGVEMRVSMQERKDMLRRAKERPFRYN